MDLRNTSITSYPVVYDCGVEKRYIYIDLEDKTIIRIGCFKGTRDEAIKAVSKKYQYNKEEMNKYIEKIEKCFSMIDELKLTR